MKKIAALLLAIVMVLSLAACGGEGNNNPAGTPPSTSDDPKDSDSSMPDTPQAPVDENLQFPLPATIQHDVDGTVIIATTSNMNGNFEVDQFGGTDTIAYKLIHNYHISVNDREGNLVVNPQVVRSMDTQENADGSKTYTITVWDDLYYNDGTQITAKNFVAYPLLFSSPVAVAAGGYGIAGKYFDGYTAFHAGETEVFAGIRLLDDFTFSYTVTAENTPFYYELNILNCSQYSRCYPIDYKTWIGEEYDIADDGNGCYITGGEFTAEKLSQHVNDTRYNWQAVRTAGPYKFKNVDLTAQVVELTVDPMYKGNFEGYKPSIENVVIKYVNTATMLDSLKTGEVTLIEGLNTGEMINAALDLETGGGYNTTSYLALQYFKLFFQCDWGPQQFIPVRQAVAYLLDREGLVNTIMQGYGSVVDAPISKEYWMYKESEEEMMERLNAYTFNVDKAVELLVSDGWIYDENGNDYVSGIRWKQVTQEEYDRGDPDNRCKKLDDGTILMPLVLTWAAYEGNTATESIDILLAQAKTTEEAGMKIERTTMAGAELLKYLNRSPAPGEQYAQPTYSFLNLSTGLKTIFDQTYRFTLDPDLILNNKNRCFDEELDRLSMEMLIGMDPEDHEGFRKMWVDYNERFNYLLPEIPLYNVELYTIYSDHIQGYEVTPHFTFYDAIVEAWWE